MDLARTLLSADTVVFAGCSTNTTLIRHERELVGEETTCIHLSDAVHEIGKNQPADAAIIGDSGVVMGELATRLRERLDDETREERLETVRSVKEMVEGQMAAMGEDDPRASKAELVDALRETVPDAYIVDEGITAKYAMLTRWPLQAEQYVSNKGSGLGYGLPASVGAALAESQRETPSIGEPTAIDREQFRSAVASAGDNE